jgi:rhamnosyltransferase
MIKISAIVVAFNPNIKELEDSINIILTDHVNDLIVVNNSEYELNLNIDRCEVLNLMTNAGIARAQTVGMSYAFDRGADFVLQMDQDSKPDPGMVGVLLQAYKELVAMGHKVGLVGPIDVDRDAGKVNDYWWAKRNGLNKDYLIVDATLSSGSLIPRGVYEDVGGMFDDLFIDAVDFEYCWRISAAGYKIYRIPQAILRHRLGEGEKSIFGLKLFRVPKPFRHYYAFRNSVYLMRKAHAPLYWKISSCVKMVIKYSTYWLILDDGFLRFKYMTKGIYHGLKSKLGVMR